MRPLLLIAVLAGCADGRTLFEVPVSVAGSPATVTTDEGVQVTLTTASYTLSDLRLEYPADTTASLWQRFSPIAAATAHPGHDFAGGVGGELVGEWTVDVLAAQTDLGVALMYDGVYATGHLTLPEGGTVRLEGTAQTEDGDRAFAFALVPDQAITGIPFDTTVNADAPPVAITIGLDLGHALSFVDWSTEDSDANGVLTVDDGVLHNTVTFGVVATPTFTLNLESP